MPTKALGHQPADFSGVGPVTPGARLCLRSQPLTLRTESLEVSSGSSVTGTEFSVSCRN